MVVVVVAESNGFQMTNSPASIKSPLYPRASNFTINSIVVRRGNATAVEEWSERGRKPGGPD